MKSHVLVVGGGPAGAAAAIAAAQRGLSVTLVESEAFPREQPGETLHPGIAPLLATLGMHDLDWPRLDGIWSSTGEGPRFHAYGADEQGSWRGYHVWRASFDQRLLDRAREVGCTVLQPVRALSVLDCPTRILTSQGVLEGDVVVDASGRREWLARRAHLRTRFCSRPLYARYGYSLGGAVGPDPLWTTDSGGWTWTARVTGDLTAWVRLTRSREAANHAWRPERICTLADARPVRGADVTWRRREAPAGPGYFCVGDAAAVLDPSSSQGVLRALMTGIMAGHLAAQSSRGACAVEAAAATYNRWLAAHHAYEIKRLTYLRRQCKRRLPIGESRHLN